MITQGISGGAKADVALTEGRAASDTLKQQSKQSHENARLARQDADLVQEASFGQQQEVDLDTAELVGEAKTVAGAGNVALDDGNAGDFENRARAQAARDKGNIQQDAEIQKARFQNESKNLLVNAGRLRKASRRRRRASQKGAIASGLGSGASIAGSFSSSRQSQRETSFAREQSSRRQNNRRNAPLG